MLPIYLSQVRLGTGVTLVMLLFEETKFSCKNNRIFTKTVKPKLFQWYLTDLLFSNGNCQISCLDFTFGVERYIILALKAT